MQDYYAVGYNLKKWLQSSVRQILLCMFVSAMFAFPFVDYGDETGMRSTVSLFAGVVLGFPLWLLVKFARFVMGR